MKYTVSINEKKRTVTVNLDGYAGVARCCPTDCFNVQTGVELALERAKVAKKNAENAKKCAEKTAPAKPMGVMELVKALEKALPKGQMVLVGEGKELTEAQKKWLADLAGVKPCECACHEGYTEDEMEDARNKAYEEGRMMGYEDAYEEGYDAGRQDGICEAEIDKEALYEELMENISEAVKDVLG